MISISVSISRLILESFFISGTICFFETLQLPPKVAVKILECTLNILIKFLAKSTSALSMYFIISAILKTIVVNVIETTVRI